MVIRSLGATGQIMIQKYRASWSYVRLNLISKLTEQSLCAGEESPQIVKDYILRSNCLVI